MCIYSSNIKCNTINLLLGWFMSKFSYYHNNLASAVCMSLRTNEYDYNKIIPVHYSLSIHFEWISIYSLKNTECLTPSRIIMHDYNKN